MSSKTYVLKLTSAIVMDGEICTKDTKIEVTEKEAKNLLARGKAVIDSISDDEEDLEDYTVAELKEMADDMGLSGYSDLRKAELIAFIEAAEEEAAEEEADDGAEE